MGVFFHCDSLSLIVTHDVFIDFCFSEWKPLLIGSLNPHPWSVIVKVIGNRDSISPPLASFFGCFLLFILSVLAWFRFGLFDLVI